MARSFKTYRTIVSIVTQSLHLSSSLIINKQFFVSVSNLHKYQHRLSKMVEKESQLSALDIGELDMFVDSMEPWRIENIGNQA